MQDNRGTDMTLKHSRGHQEASSVQKSSAVYSTQGELICKDLSAAVKGFVVASDRDLLLSDRKKVMKRHHCYICGQDFALARVCETHKILEHNVPAQWKCSECGMQFIQGTMYNLHMTRSHSAEPYVCGIDDCQAVFHCNMQLTLHKHQCHNSSEGKEKMLFKCQYCPAEFPHPCRLKYHMRTHTGEEPYKCHHCSRTFKSSSHRTMHVKTVHATHKIRNHLCDWCGKKFFSGDQLRRHVRSHTGEKPYTCHVCSRSFSKSNTMHVHMRQHTGEKPYVCDQCGQSFTVRVSLRTHLKSKHNVIVDTSMYRRREEPEDSCIPPIGRPKRKNMVKARQVLEQRKDEMDAAKHESTDLGLNNTNSGVDGFVTLAASTIQQLLKY